MKNLIRHIPNALTTGNLLSGVYGIILVMQGNITAGTVMIWVGALFDFADGFAARILKANSDIGKELDSLADMVTFGTLPALVMFALLKDQLPLQYSFLAFSALLTPAFSALRLAKFNIDPEQKENFRGLPTPANAFLLSGIPFLTGSRFLHDNGLLVLELLIILFGSLLMVSNIRFPSLKFKTYRPAKNVARYMIIFSSIVLLISFRLKGITPVMFTYVLISLINNINSSRTPGKAEEK